MLCPPLTIYLLCFLPFATAAPPPSLTLAHYITALCGLDQSATLTISQCISSTTSPNAGISTSTVGRPSGVSQDSFILYTLLQAHPEVAPLTACLLEHSLVLPSVISKFGGALLFASASPRLFAYVAPTPTDPGALFSNLVRAGAAVNHTLSPRDGFNVLHKALSSDQRVPDDLANMLLQPHLPRGYKAYLAGVVEGIAGRLLTSPAVAEAVRAAGRGLLSNRTLRSSSSSTGRLSLLGYSVPFSPIATLSRAVSIGIIGALAKNTTAQQLAALISQRDKFGRTPFHMAALQDNALAVELLAGALPPMDAALVLLARDAAGYTAGDLAMVLGHTATAHALEKASGGGGGKEVEERQKHTPLTPSLLPRQKGVPVYPSPLSTAIKIDVSATNGEGDGGWGEPAYVSPTARAAVTAVQDSRFGGVLATGGCDVDVVSAGDFTPQLFIQEYFLPRRPVLVRGLVAATPGWSRAAWQREALLAAHGAVVVEPGVIPYAASFSGGRNGSSSSSSSSGDGGGGGGGGATGVLPSLPLREFVTRLFSCTPDMKEGHPECEAWAGGGGEDATLGSDGSAVVVDPPLQHRPLHAPYVFQRLSEESGSAMRNLIASLALPPPFLAQARLPTWTTPGDSRGTVSKNNSVPFLAPSPPSSILPELYLGGPGSGAPMHFHGDAFNALMWGGKAWFLLPPGEAHYSTVPPAVDQGLLGGGGGGGGDSCGASRPRGMSCTFPRGGGMPFSILIPVWALQLILSPLFDGIEV